MKIVFSNTYSDYSTPQLLPAPPQLPTPKYVL